MTLEYRVRIGGETHDVRVDVPAERLGHDQDAIHEFAIATALLEHYGYLPRGVVNAVE